MYNNSRDKEEYSTNIANMYRHIYQQNMYYGI